MSIINKVLEDLDNNQHRIDADKKEVLSGIKVASHTHHMNKFFLFCSFTLFIFAMITAIYVFMPSNNFFKFNVHAKENVDNQGSFEMKEMPIKESATTKTEEQSQQDNAAVQDQNAAQTEEQTAKQAEQEVANEVSEPVDTTAALDGVSIQTADDTTTVNFQLNKEAHYSIAHGGNHQELFITFADTKLNDNIQPSVQNTSITSMQLNKEHKNIKVSMKLLPGTSVQTLQMQEKAKPILELVLDNPQQTEILAQQVKKQVIPLTPEQKAQEKYEDALQAINNNEFNSAIVMLRDALKIDSSLSAARETLTVLLIQSDQTVEAKRVLMIGLRQQPNYEPYVKLLARIYAQEGQVTRAISLLKSSAPSLDQDPAYYAFLAALYQKDGQYIAAAQIYDQLVKYRSDQSIWWVGLGVSLEKAGKSNAAIEAFQKALQGGTLDPSVRVYVQNQLNNL